MKNIENSDDNYMVNYWVTKRIRCNFRFALFLFFNIPGVIKMLYSGRILIININII